MRAFWSTTHRPRSRCALPGVQVYRVDFSPVKLHTRSMYFFELLLALLNCVSLTVTKRNSARVRVSSSWKR